MNKKGSKMTRTLHLLDAENLARTSHCTPESVLDSYFHYTDLFEPTPTDLWIIAASHHNAGAVFFGWSSLSFQALMRSGPDGAELALIEACLDQIDNLKVSHVVIGSGDGLFVDLVLELQRRGISVTVVGFEGHTSARLRLAANQTFLLRDTDVLEGAHYAVA
jgi:NYN domain